MFVCNRLMQQVQMKLAKLKSKIDSIVPEQEVLTESLDEVTVLYAFHYHFINLSLNEFKLLGSLVWSCVYVGLCMKSFHIYIIFISYICFSTISFCIIYKINLINRWLCEEIIKAESRAGISVLEMDAETDKYVTGIRQNTKIISREMLVKHQTWRSNYLIIIIIKMCDFTLVVFFITLLYYLFYVTFVLFYIVCIV